MDQQEQSLIDRIKQAQNVLVTVSANPSVDQLAAAIGLTVALNKLEKHGTAVFSGQTPNTIEFLKPEETLEKNTDSLRDFIIALDKSKADKLRYKVEDQVVRIFITPYKTSLSQKDLEFSQGDFNVDVVIALGVGNQQDIDTAITAHGRILHDATVASISLSKGDLGTINWVDGSASALSEMMLGLIDGLDKKLLDSQIATALLTGIVASTDRFRNEKTSPKAMSASAELMAAGANQQLIATELDRPPQPPPEPEHKSEESAPEPKKEDDAHDEPPHEPGELDIDHADEEEKKADDAGAPTEPVKPEEPEQPQIHVDDEGQLSALDEEVSPDQSPFSTPTIVSPQISEVHGVKPDGRQAEPEEDKSKGRRERMMDPPTMGDASMTANTAPDEGDSSTEELSLPQMPPLNAPLLKHNESVLPSTSPSPMSATVDDPFIPQEPLQPAPEDWQAPEPPRPESAPTPPPPPLPPAPMPDPTPPPLPPPPTPPPFEPPQLDAMPMPLPPPPMLAPAPAPGPMPAQPFTPPMPLADSGPLVPVPAPPPFSPPPLSAGPMPPAFNAPPLPPLPTPSAPSGFSPDETLSQIEQSIGSPHAQFGQPPVDTPPPLPANNVDDARSAVEAALNAAAAPAPNPEPIAALNAQPLGGDLHPGVPMPPPPPPPVNAGFSEPTPGNTPADEALDMPLPSNPFGPAQPPASSPMTPPSSFPATPFPPGVPSGGATPPPPVPPPMLPPLQ